MDTVKILEKLDLITKRLDDIERKVDILNAKTSHEVFENKKPVEFIAPEILQNILEEVKLQEELFKPQLI